MAEQPRLNFKPQKCDTEEEFFLQHDFYAFYSFLRVGIAALKLCFLKVAWDDSVCPGGAGWTTRMKSAACVCIKQEGGESLGEIL